jgi:hypothetical protein
VRFSTYEVYLRRVRAVAAAGLAALLASGCASDDGVDWRKAGDEQGQRLVQNGQSRTPELCAGAVRAYIADVGVPQGDDVRKMQEGCEG